MKLVLASASPRRQELISLISQDVLCVPSGVEEIVPENINTPDIPLCLAFQKAEAVAKEFYDYIVIGCDTGVILGNEILGKPKDKEDARRMITALSGKVHQVVTGCAIFYKGKTAGFSNITDVEFYPLSSKEIEDYINTTEPYDKAGGYGIQGKAGLFVKGIKGDYFNVVGLPVSELNREINRLLAEN
ncbi:MAG: septum formation protein Maf [Clostridia bacterium]|nr:septum formation protein Maf [Clostridia bacterium]